MGDDDMDTGTDAARDSAAVPERSDLRLVARSMSAAQRDHAKSMCRMIALRMPNGVVKHMLERAARDNATDDIIRKIDEQTLMVVHFTLDIWEAGRTHSEMIR
jgi:hypothetical protein